MEKDYSFRNASELANLEILIRKALKEGPIYKELIKKKFLNSDYPNKVKIYNDVYNRAKNLEELK